MPSVLKHGETEGASPQRAFLGVAPRRQSDSSTVSVTRDQRAKESESVLDLMFIAIVLVFFGLSFGYAAFCDRL